MDNPFNPSFGIVPKVYIGREQVKNDFYNNIDKTNGIGKSFVVIGMRGSGKTTLLRSIEKKLEKKAIVVSTTSHTDILNVVIDQLYKKTKKTPKDYLKSLSSFSIGSFGIGLKDIEDFNNRTFWYKFSVILDELKKENIPLVILIDEIQKTSLGLRTLITTYQEMIGKDYNISIMVAGLPLAITELSNDDTLSFFKRADKVYLENLYMGDVFEDYKKEFEVFGYENITNLLEYAAAYSYGYPYLVQLVGYYLWEYFSQIKSSDDITEESVNYYLDKAKSKLFSDVHELVYSDLTKVEKDFIKAMSYDTKTSQFSDIMDRLNKDKNYISTYRSRLKKLGVIKGDSYGEMEFTLPYMNEFLQNKITNYE